MAGSTRDIGVSQSKSAVQSWAGKNSGQSLNRNETLAPCVFITSVRCCHVIPAVQLESHGSENSGF